jgi:arylsulfatase
MFCNRGIYHKGWTAVTKHSTPWSMTADMPALDDDVWELYAPDDWSQAHDIAAENPAMLHRLQQLFLIEAAKYNVLPLDDRRIERFNPDLAGRPQLVRGNRQLVFGGTKRLPENAVLNIKNKSHAVTAEIDVSGDASGVIIAQGGSFGGWSLYTLNGRLTYCYNLLGLKRFKVIANLAIPSGTHQVRMEFAYDGGGLGKGGAVTLYLNGRVIAEGRVDQTQAMVFSADETTDLGSDTATPVSDDYGSADSAFNGRVRWVEIDIDKAAADTDHLISPEERYRIAISRQ